jgi:hypothetical protein
MLPRHVDIAAILARQREYNHNIPDVIIQLTNELENVAYRDLLSDFAKSYYPTEFPTLRDEFTMVRDLESRLATECFGLDIAKELDRVMRADLAATAIEEGYRDHFIHAFQAFLTGIVVIDRFYDDFSKWYSSNLNRVLKTSLESSWLLTALFHDQFRPFPVISEFVEQETKLPIELQDEVHAEKLADNLASLYDHLRNGKPLESWVPPDSRTEHPLKEILLSQLKNRNHGVVGGFTLLTHRLHDEINRVSVYGSALAISLHDKRPREEFLKHKIFPIEMEKYPTIALLLYCDVIQEWNRSTRSTADLVDVQFLEKEVMFLLRFGSDYSKCLKEQEFDGVNACIASRPIKLGFARAEYLGPAEVAES